MKFASIYEMTKDGKIIIKTRNEVNFVKHENSVILKSEKAKF